MAEHIPSVVIWGDGGGSTFRATVDAIDEQIVDFEIAGVITVDPMAGILNEVKRANKQLGMDIEPFVAKGEIHKVQDEESQDQVINFLDRLGVDNLSLMGSLVIMGGRLVEYLNGDVLEDPLPKDLEGARKLMLPSDDGFGYYLPHSFPIKAKDASQYGLINTHPAPTIVTANKWGIGAQRRMLKLKARESAFTVHAVASGVDTGPILDAHKFPIRLVSPNASTVQFDRLAKSTFSRAQKIEKAYLPLILEEHLYDRQQASKS